MRTRTTLLLAAAVLALGAGAPPAFARHRPHHHRAHGTTPAAVRRQAAALARQVNVAHSSRARVRALNAVMRGLHVAIVRPNGRVIARGAPGAAKLHLYDFELKVLAAQLARHRTITVAELADTLGQSGLRARRGPIPAASVARALRASMHDLVHRAHRSDLGGLVVRDLGLHRHVDLARHVSPTTKLDALQSELVLMDFAALVAPRRARAGAVVARAASAGDVCDAVDRRHKEISKAVNKALSANQDGLAGAVINHVSSGQVDEAVKELGGVAVERAESALAAAQGVIDAVHGSLLAGSIRARALQESPPPVHYNHQQSDGHVLRVGIQVYSLDGYGKTKVSCGRMIGADLPVRAGGLKGVPISWRNLIALNEHGAVDCPVDGCQTTDGDGVAMLTLRLKTERLPGFGYTHEAEGNLDGVALYQSAFGGGIVGKVAEQLFPVSGTIHWRIQFHREPKLFLRLHSTVDNPDLSQSFQGHSGSQHFALTSQVPLTLSPDASQATGAGALGWDTFSSSDSVTFQSSAQCHADTSHQDAYRTSTTGTGTPTPGQLSVDSGQVIPAAGTGDPGVSVTFSVAKQPAESYHSVTQELSNPACTSVLDYTSSQWANHFFESLQRNLASGVSELVPFQRYQLDGWTRGPGPGPNGTGGVLAVKEVDWTLNGTTVHNTFEIVAEPDLGP